MFYIGNHVSSSNGFEAMGRKTTELGGNTFAFFTRNPRGGKAKDLDFDDINRLLAWMQEFAPSLFNHPYVRRRVNLYGMIYEMDLLCDYPMGAWPRERLERYLSETLW